jgi:anti-anti-sigma factor
VAVFQIETRDEATLVLTGELDLAGEQRLEAAIERARGSAGTLTIDLSGLEFIDSSGLRVLVRLHNASLQEGFAYTIIPGPPQVHRTFVLCGLDETLPFTTNQVG